MSLAFQSLPFLWQGLLVTLHVSALVVLLSLAVGVVLGVALAFGPRWLYWPIRMYSDFLRGVPLLVLIFFVYYGLPVFRINLSNFWAAVFALAAFKTAHVIEIVRGAVQSIPRGQTDAGRAIGLLVSLVGIVDLMLAIQQVIGRTYVPLPMYVLGALMYFAINYSLSLTSRRLEARFAYVRE
jgi:polar amino acid transport system permease protein